MLQPPRRSILVLLSLLLFVPQAHAQLFESVDFAGKCYGTPAQPGSTKELTPGKAYELEAYGSEFGHHCTEDQGRFLFQEMEGDFDVATRVVDVHNEKKTAAKACLMARELTGEASSARFAAIMAIADLPFARRHDHGFPDSFTFDVRVQRGGNLKNEGFRYAAQDLKERRRYPNVWLRLKRTGDRITAFFGKDGVRWTEVKPEDSWLNLPTIPLGKRVAVGLCLSSEPEVKPDIRAVARFDRLRGFRSKGAARLAPSAQPPTEEAAVSPPPVTPKRRPLGLGRTMPMREEPFDLLPDGTARKLAENVGDKGLLLVFAAEGCADASPRRLAALTRPFEAKGVRTLLVHTTPTAPKTDGLPVLHDRSAALARALGATAGGQAFLFGKDAKLLYSGAVSGVDHARKRRVFLKEALVALTTGAQLDVAQSPVADCRLPGVD